MPATWWSTSSAPNRAPSMRWRRCGRSRPRLPSPRPCAPAAPGSRRDRLPDDAGVKLLIACIGRSNRGPERDLYDHYANRIRWPLALRELEEKKKLPPAQLMLREGDLLLEATPAGATLVALDRRGKVLDSQAFAGRLARWRDN